MFTPIIYALAILVLAAVLYGIYKVIWYIWKILRFNMIIKKASTYAERKRRARDTFFGEKGPVDIIVTKEDKKYSSRKIFVPAFIILKKVMTDTL